MRVKARPADEGACGFYRVTEPTRVLSQSGVDVELFEGRVWAGTVKNGVGAYVDADPPDVVVIQRPLTRHTAEVLIPFVQSKGVAVVVEIDDDFTCINPRNLAFHFSHQRRDPDRNASWMRKAASVADMVTCTTPALARRYAEHGRVAVIPNYIPAGWLDIPHTGDGRTVGWAGNLLIHPNDLEPVGPNLGLALATAGGHWLGIGDGNAARRLRIDPELGTYVAWVWPEIYGHTVARLDIGLVPLIESAFNNAKSALKMCEYAALGVVPVVSPTPDNVRIHKAHGIGYVANTPKEWMAHVRRLLTNDEDRKAAAAYNREMVRQHLTIEANAWRYAEAWEMAVRYRKARDTATKQKEAKRVAYEAKLDARKAAREAAAAEYRATTSGDEHGASGVRQGRTETQLSA